MCRKNYHNKKMVIIALTPDAVQTRSTESPSYQLVSVQGVHADDEGRRGGQDLDEGRRKDGDEDVRVAHRVELGSIR
jgi:hypothetical protein